ncbi:MULTISPECIES: hypothetical protein [Akkermansia]|uniref:Uncharacterized protein n=1 Tax=Akkermansia massiliensis TaxID=2927224 RepID=A0ABT0RBR0_9BACT|nr:MULTISPECIES: hypothetical protein [Akkermansia]MBT8772937.1 hypothetical protein [Akkermansia muciniphila]MBP8662515.1 hypothetical protein [Akkermansia sp.]MBP9526349.1 hypothetical protein [Akkermansia sp.]MBT8776402.1 hypothetical protein [Akkermansia muciniphila]MBT8780360.1 hypothetical protein [Akkermansia muciniphila]
MLKQIPFGRFTVAHGIKDYNQISPVSFDLIMQHLCRENIIRKKRKGAQGEEKRYQYPGKRAGGPFPPPVQSILKEIQAD